ncbi:MAG: hypothetical protein HC910_22075 [Spirulinaceae cyanobacterium SM2_1_0]|nr:hypothetical protein [Spirulinaceae cyanobacterium SM2_1_0]
MVNIPDSVQLGFDVIFGVGLIATLIRSFLPQANPYIKQAAERLEAVGAHPASQLVIAGGSRLARYLADGKISADEAEEIGYSVQALIAERLKNKNTAPPTISSDA